ncbi:hypothetical protein JL100_025975 [Skermanella mucosa]|uniref:hypothetical protein n=1 Tax=Skermanella mucosa TaxID=1789672 RepID=UPI00192C8962|nr:hypothetical protein [Skermanella mucosa]UEM20487.1 hypothetical protein JL100_025975 [Skermanella mucosa]
MSDGDRVTRLAVSTLSLGEKVDQILQVQAEHTRILDEHTRILGEHTRILGEHTRTLGEHGEMLATHTKQLTNLENGQATLIDNQFQMNRSLDAILAHLGIPKPA